MVLVPDAVTSAEERGELRREYEAYRKRQAARLVHLMPREAVRPLFRRARRCMAQEGGAVEAGATADDPLELLIRYCETLLPLPPFEVWIEDVRRHPDAYLTDLDEVGRAPTAHEPATVEVRDLVYRGRRWTARLQSYRDREAWRAYIAFTAAEGGGIHRTAPIFREADPMALRERFADFEPAALEAFLRSALP